MGVLCVWSWWMCIPIVSIYVHVGGGGWTIGGATEPAGHDHAQWQHRSFQGDSLSISERFGQDRKLYEEVMRTWCFTAKDLNWSLHHGQQVWRMIKISITFQPQGQRMILSDCEVGGVTSVGGRLKLPLMLSEHWMISPLCSKTVFTAWIWRFHLTALALGCLCATTLSSILVLLGDLEK